MVTIEKGEAGSVKEETKGANFVKEKYEYHTYQKLYWKHAMVEHTYNKRENRLRYGH